MFRQKTLAKGHEMIMLGSPGSTVTTIVSTLAKVSGFAGKMSQFLA